MAVVGTHEHLLLTVLLGWLFGLVDDLFGRGLCPWGGGKNDWQ
jgi:hypothetical protein